MLTMKDIIREGHPTLNKTAKEVQQPVTKEVKQILFSMMEFIKNSQDQEKAEKYELRPGVGLAAPQINVSLRMIAVHTTDENNENTYSYMLINPKIVSHSEEMTYISQGEGCLSVDREIQGVVLRYKRITVKALELKETGEVAPISIRLKDYVSIVFQHEIDHLNGILFVDKVENPVLIPDEVKPVVFN